MSKLFAYLLAAATVAALAASPVALAGHAKPKSGDSGGCAGVSAVCVYHEGGLPNAGGGSTGGSTGGGATPSRLARKLAHYNGPDKRLLEELAQAATAGPRLLEDPAGAGGAPGLLGAIFDSGAGPTALFALIVGTLVLGGAWEGRRRWRRR